MQHLAVLAAVFLLLTQFNNCSSPMSADSSSVAAVSCTTPNCIAPTPGNLNVSAFYGTDVQTQLVLSGSSGFNVAGECNEGGYGFGVIKWTLLRANGASWSSDQAGQAANYCVNGRFLAYITNQGQGFATGDNVRLQIFGMAVLSSATGAAPQSTSLVPLSIVSSF